MGTGSLSRACIDSPQSSTTWSNCLTHLRPASSAAQAASTAPISGRMEGRAQRAATSDALRCARDDWTVSEHAVSDAAAAEPDEAAAEEEEEDEVGCWQKSHALHLRAMGSLSLSYSALHQDPQRRNV